MGRWDARDGCHKSLYRFRCRLAPEVVQHGRELYARESDWGGIIVGPRSLQREQAAAGSMRGLVIVSHPTYAFVGMPPKQCLKSSGRCLTLTR